MLTKHCCHNTSTITLLGLNVLQHSVQKSMSHGTKGGKCMAFKFLFVNVADAS